MTPGTVLITGAAARIGRALSLALAEDGWAVAVHYNRSAEPAQALVAEIAQAGGRAIALGADLLDLDAVERLIPQAQDALGSVTALINNASAFEDDEIGRLTAESFALHMNVNLRAPVFLAQALARRLPKDQSGAVVNLLDQRVKKPVPLFFSYGLSKAALAEATVTLAQALAPRIRVNGVGPGPTLMNTRQQPEDFQAQVDATILATGSPPEEIVRAVRYLLGAQAVTGQWLAVDGGQHLFWKTPDVWGIRE
ncbi:MAG: SDR family oxidoreductase [Maricaulaceae bacterium]